MHTPNSSEDPRNPHGSGEHGSGEIDASKGFEQSDIRVTGIVVFLTALAILVVVTAVLCYGIGKVINAHMNAEDGPNTKWTKTADLRSLGNLPASPELQKKVYDLTRTFPSPRVQLDDGNQDTADLHEREDLLLDNYSWADKSKGRVRIPIERAMEIIAQHGLPVAPPAQQAPLMTGDVKPQVTAPLTDGFAPTAYEQELARTRAAEEGHPEQ